MISARLWAADPHQFGPGKVHAIDDEKPNQTYCGKITSAYPGKPVASGKVTCKICCDAPSRRAEAKARAIEWQRRYEQEQYEREQQRDHDRREHTERYHAYLNTQQWREKSASVIRRAGGVCEGCGKNRATQAHHLTYEHVFDEFLWELRAVCEPCHKRWHASERAA